MTNLTAIAMIGFSATSPANSNLTFYVVSYDLRYERQLVALPELSGKACVTA
jgi:hypothetical protein